MLRAARCVQAKKIEAEVLGPLSRWEKAYEAVQVRWHRQLGACCCWLTARTRQSWLWCMTLLQLAYPHSTSTLCHVWHVYSPRHVTLHHQHAPSGTAGS